MLKIFLHSNTFFHTIKNKVFQNYSLSGHCILSINWCNILIATSYIFLNCIIYYNSTVDTDKKKKKVQKYIAVQHK